MSIFGWSSEHMNGNSMTSLCIALYWGSASTIVDPHGHFRWIYKKYIENRPMASKKHQRFTSPQFCNSIPQASDTTSWRSQRQIIVTKLNLDTVWLQYRVLRMINEESKTRRQSVARRKSLSSRRKSSVKQAVGNEDFEKMMEHFWPSLWQRH